MLGEWDVSFKKAEDDISAFLSRCADKLFRYFNVRANAKSVYIFKNGKRPQPASTIEFFRW